VDARGASKLDAVTDRFRSACRL